FNAYRRLDLHYVENWNLWLDLRILLATAEQVIVTFALLPLRFFRRRSDQRVDGIAPANEGDRGQVIDLRDRNRARLAAAEENSVSSKNASSADTLESGEPSLN
ncbi:MAG: hypothetical protein AAFO29_24265, partial [Actinomycetota bacterium]